MPVRPSAAGARKGGRGARHAVGAILGPELQPERIGHAPARVTFLCFGGVAEEGCKWNKETKKLYIRQQAEVDSEAQEGQPCWVEKSAGGQGAGGAAIF